MPVVRLSRRRRSSLALSTSINPAKAGYYGINPVSPRSVTFAPNVTPGTYVEPEIIPSSPSTPCPESPTSRLFPPSELPPPPPTRRRVPPGKRRSMGYIPRPPNAFMLFRADFVRQKHVPGSIETNHGSLSKIIGNCWRSLPLEEKHVWEVKAKHAKAEHKQRYPEYRFRPVHTKNKDKLNKKDKPTVTPEDERRCEEVAQLLLEGKKGDELAAAVRDLDRMRSDSPPANVPLLYGDGPDGLVLGHRRSSSVPLPNEWHPIAIPSVPFFPGESRRESRRLSLMDRMLLGSRRSSSARPSGGHRSWTMPSMGMGMMPLQRDDSTLPEVDTSLFDPAFLDAAAGFTFPPVQSDNNAFNFNEFRTTLPPNANSPHDIAVSPLDNPFNNNAYMSIPTPSSSSSVPFTTNNTLPELDPLTWLPVDSHSHPSTAYSGSPSPSDESLPVQVHAPQALHAHAQGGYELWKDIQNPFHHQSQSQSQTYDHESALGLNFSSQSTDASSCGGGVGAGYGSGLESLFNATYGSGGVGGQGGGHEMDFGFDNNDIRHDF